MQPMRTHRGQVIPLDLANVDTDQIIPKQFLKRIERTGYGPVSYTHLEASMAITCPATDARAMEDCPDPQPTSSAR